MKIGPAMAIPDGQSPVLSIVADVSISDNRWMDGLDVESVARAAIQRAAGHAARFPVQHPETEQEVSVLFCGDQEIRNLNAQWRGIDKPTNVLAFPVARGQSAFAPGQLGDIAIAFETCMREAVEQAIAPRDHVTHLVVHGFLHLVGFDHESDSEAEQMEQMEIEILAALGIGNPYT